VLGQRQPDATGADRELERAAAQAGQQVDRLGDRPGVLAVVIGRGDLLAEVAVLVHR